MDALRCVGGDLAMPDNAETSNVSLDTQVFDAHQLDLSSPNLKRLGRLGAAGTIQLLLTSVTEGEVRKHLDEKAKELLKQIKTFRRSSRILKGLLPQSAID